MSRPGFGRNGDPGIQTTENLLSNVGSVASLKPTAKYHSGARCVLKVNGKLVGFAFSVSWNIQTDNTEVYTIDDYLPYELAPRMISVSGTLGMFVIPGRSSTSEGLQSNVLSFMQNKYISLEVSDSATGTLIFKTAKAVITGQQTSVQSEQLSVSQLTWKAIGWQNEFLPETPVDESSDPLSIKNLGGKITGMFKPK